MTGPRFTQTALYLCICLLLCSCAYPTLETTPAADTAPLATLEPRAGEKLLRVDAQKSLIQIYTYRGGRLAKFGHNHVIAARRIQGSATLTAQVRGSRFNLRVPLAALTVDEPALRLAAGSDFASEPTADDIAATRANMLGPDGLAAAEFPAASITGEITAVNGARASLTITLQLRGQSVTLKSGDNHFERTSSGTRLSGQLRVRQSDLGMTAFSALGGALVVLDEVVIHYDVVAHH
ncbi:MAG: hypothetical protein GKR94_24620 [Gammaproteobacteria bacterium]|nr:hypothetical protein [Gammaproteobacteria bacterium]